MPDRLALFVQRLFEAQPDWFEILAQPLEFVRTQQLQDAIPMVVIAFGHNGMCSYVSGMTYARVSGSEQSTLDAKKRAAVVR